jgi:hypothetical protein
MSYEYGFVIARIWLSARLQDVCVHIYINTYIYIYLSIYIYYIYNYNIHTHIHTPTYIYTLYFCIGRTIAHIYIQRTYMYMYIYIHAHTHIYTYPLSACPDLRSLASESVFFTWRHSRALFVSQNLESRTIKTMLSFFLPPLWATWNSTIDNRLVLTCIVCLIHQLLFWSIPIKIT